MSRFLPLVWYYLSYYRGKTATLLVCLTVAIALPLTTHQLVNLLQTEMVQRAESTPIVIGPEGSRFDLVLHALYFQTAPSAVIPQEEQMAIQESGYATAIPLLIRHRARGRPIVGTTLDYFAFRDLQIEAGRPLTMLGDCVVGWQVARDLHLRPGDRLLSDPENVFDLAGAYPMDMRVSGVLARTHNPDDHAVFVDVRTAWIIEGIGHGHDAELDTSTDSDAILERNRDHLVASPALQTFTRITPENVASFHFHGDPNDFPLTAIIAIPRDARAGTLLLGRYVADDSRYQALRPTAVIEELLGMVIQLKRFFDAHHLFTLGITALLIVLVMMLSLRLRRQEMETMFHLGCSRGTIINLQAAELALLLTVSAVLAFGVSHLLLTMARTWIQTLTG